MEAINCAYFDIALLDELQGLTCTDDDPYLCIMVNLKLTMDTLSHYKRHVSRVLELHLVVGLKRSQNPLFICPDY